MPRSAGPKFARVVNVPVELNRRFEFTIACPFDETSDGFQSGTTVHLLSTRYSGDEIEKVESLPNFLKCSNSALDGAKFLLEGKESSIGIKVFSLHISYRVSGQQYVYEQIVNVIVRVYNDEMLWLDPDLKKNVKKSKSLKCLTPDFVQLSRLHKTFETSKFIDKKLNILMQRLKSHEGGEQYLNSDLKGPLIKWNLLQTLSPNNYAVKFDVMNCYERRQEEHDLRVKTIKNACFRKHEDVFILDVTDGSLDERDVREGDTIKAIPKGSDIGARGYVLKVLLTDFEVSEIVVRFSKNFSDFWGPNVQYTVRILLNPFVYIESSKILRIVGRDINNPSSSWRKFLFPLRDDIPDYDVIDDDTLDFEGGLNPAQKVAVQRIMSGGGRTVPYIIFGPPGTGKTKTLVEAIRQTYALNKRTILVSAPSNASADLLALRLLRYFPDDVARDYAGSRREELIPLELKDQHAEEGKIIVSTFAHARSFFYYYPQFKFYDLFMDEVGHATELTALCSISGLVDFKRARVVLAGDPYQLGPVVKSTLSRENGMEISFLERLMECDIYKPDRKTGKYDERVITKLTQNYRSHKDLLVVPNDLFYHGDLVACAPYHVQNAFIGWRELPNLFFPMIFHGIVGQESQEENGFSYYNLEEAVSVANYLEKIARKQGPLGASGKDIAVLTPYRGQKKIIQKMLADRRLMPNITIGSTEELQGKEKSVVIISTVRSQPELADESFKYKIGFLNSPKRFNVATTRAKSLLIVVGNPLVLEEDRNWRTLIDFVINRGGYTGYKAAKIRKEISVE